MPKEKVNDTNSLIFYLLTSLFYRNFQLFIPKYNSLRFHFLSSIYSIVLFLWTGKFQTLIFNLWSLSDFHYFQLCKLLSTVCLVIIITGFFLRFSLWVLYFKYRLHWPIFKLSHITNFPFFFFFDCTYDKSFVLHEILFRFLLQFPCSVLIVSFQQSSILYHFMTWNVKKILLKINL